jgi:hypothetical protein
MRKVLSFSSILIFLLIFSGGNLFSQEASSRKTYEISLIGIKTPADAQKVDQAMLSKNGILKSKTDPKTGKITVTVEDGIDFNMLKSVILASGFEAREDGLIIRQENQTH